MSNEVSNTNSNPSLASYALMPSIYVGVNTINNARYFKKAIPEFGKKGSDFGKLTNGVKYDVFQKAQFTSESYEAYRSAAIRAEKLTKLQNGKLPLKEKFLNLFRKNKIKPSDLIEKKGLKDAGKNLETIKEATNADKLRDALKGIDEGFDNSLKFIDTAKTGQSAIKSFGNQTLNNFKKEFSFAKGNRFNAGFNVAMTALQFIPNIAKKVVPAFKNNGFKAGMTELGQTLVQAGADLVSYAAGGAVGRTIGAAVGTVFGPAGTFIGGLVGDMVGSMFVGSKVCGVVEKITNKDDVKNTGDISLATEGEAVQQQEVVAAQQQMPQETAFQGNTVETAQNDMPQQDEAQMLAYNQIQAEAMQNEANTTQTAKNLNINENSLNNPEVRHAAYARVNAQRVNRAKLNSLYA